jgi:hypothetical protein
MGWCEKVVTYETSVGGGGYHVAVFRLAVVGAALLSVTYILFRLRPRSPSSSRPSSSSSASSSGSPPSWSWSWSWGRLRTARWWARVLGGGGVPVPIYFNFLLFACGTFLVVVVVYLLPDGTGPWMHVLQVAQILAIGAQWFIQVESFPSLNNPHYRENVLIENRRRWCSSCMRGTRRDQLCAQRCFVLGA